MTIFLNIFIYRTVCIRLVTELHGLTWDGTPLICLIGHRSKRASGMMATDFQGVRKTLGTTPERQVG